MVLIPVLVGLYLILSVGYFRIAVKTVTEYPISVAVLSFFWPLAIIYTLLRNAFK